ncbi:MULTISPECIES: D-alanine--D-alanine ligase [Exiguobacterium]|uniref:D-alanine--D-alanine ligase n=1 Tax=Exiguobacterium oxidotolerans TaxID=223958 RepID=A0A653ID46_9BACL|nr:MULTISPECIES: D-alanine--D-alanine ligase [Exiguobacterium]ASI35678.1 D-alanine--D-alanine ligase [Exiguobacterium sp. N4-1P]VWX36966.1 D-alanine--D-alanine ligase [Exiguobacterium oxidotolerans]
MRVAVLYGGISGEREVSLSSGKSVIQALEGKGHEVVAIDFHPERAEEIFNLDVEVAVIALHGKYGEDGRVQALLELADIPYTGSGVLASALAMDKARSKLHFEKAGIRIARDVLIERGDDIADKVRQWGGEFPCVVKPAQEGSSNGLTIAMDDAMLRSGIELAFQADDAVLIEQFIKGREVTVPVLGQKGAEKALPVIEIIPKNEFYDYESKYAVGGSEHICPADFDEVTTQKLQEWAVLAHQVLGCSGYSRSDFLVPEIGHPVILETNTLPGMTATSLFPDGARAIGIDYPELVESFINLAITRHQATSNNIK